MEKTGITFYGAHWCPDCRRSKQFLGEHQIPFRWVDIEQNSQAEQYVIQKNKGKRIIPTIEFPDGSILAEPSNADLADKLGLKSKAKRTHYDLIIAGGGPAGLTAALYAAREGMDTLVVERAAPGGQAATTERLENIPGFADGIEGAMFGKQLSRQALKFGVEMLEAQEAARIFSHDNYHCLETAGRSTYSASALLIATGSRYRRLEVPGEESFIGAGVHFCATCDGPFYKGQRVTVVGGGNSAAEESLFLLKFVEQVKLLVRGKELKASEIIREKVRRHPQIDLHFETEVVQFNGSKGKLTGLIIKNKGTGALEEIQTPAVFIFIGQMPNTSFLKGSNILLDRWGYTVTGHNLIHLSGRPLGYEKREPEFLETSVPGIFAAGDVRGGSTKQVASAAGEGATAALLIREYLKST
jgi:thioredoxin reductase (NADPH)